MASDAKFRTVLPNNNMKGDVAFTPYAEIYQEKTNYLGQREDFFWANDIKLSLSGSVSSNVVATCLIPPSYKLIGPMFLNFTFSTQEVPGGPTYVPLLPNGNFAAYNMLRQFAWRVPGCDRYYLENYNMPYKHIEDCESREKMQRLLEISGQANASNFWGSTQQASGANGANGMRPVNLSVEEDGSRVVLTMLLPLPWSSPATLGTPRAAKPYPAHLTTQPLELYFMFNDFSQVFANFTAVTGQNQPASSWTLADTSLSFLYGTLADPAQYKATKYFYASYMHFDHVYPFSYARTGLAANSTSMAIPLRGLRNGEIREILLHVGRQADAISNPYLGLPIGKMRLLYAGQKIWDSMDRNQKLWELCFDQNVVHEPPNQKIIQLRNIQGIQSTNNGAFDGLAQGTQILAAGQPAGQPSTVALTSNLYAGDWLFDSRFSKPGANSGFHNVLTLKADTLDQVSTESFNPTANFTTTRRKCADNIFYHIPVASALQRAFPGYLLGADFKDADLTIELYDIDGGNDAVGTMYNLYVQFRYNAQFLFDGQTVTIDW